MAKELESKKTGMVTIALIALGKIVELFLRKRYPRAARLAGHITNEWAAGTFLERAVRRK